MAEVLIYSKLTCSRSQCKSRVASVETPPRMRRYEVRGTRRNSIAKALILFQMKWEFFAEF